MKYIDKIRTFWYIWGMFKRIVEKKIVKSLNDREITILYGPRRVGKTTLLNAVFNGLGDKSKAKFSLDDPSSASIFLNPSSQKLKKIFRELGFLKVGKNYLFLDEIQSFDKIDVLLKIIFDQFPEVKVVATSSSSLLLLNNLTESLAGRKYFLEVLPLTLGEYAGIEVKDFFGFEDILTKIDELNSKALSMAVYGSYPEVLNLEKSEEKRAKLKDIIDSSLFKDIFILENIKAPKVLVNLVTMLSYQIGNLVNLNELSQTLGVSRNTVNEYITILEKFFIVFRLNPYEKNLRSEMGSKFKVYFWDLGVRNAVIERFYPYESREDSGGLLENLAISSILKRNYYEGRKFRPFFWRTYEGFEIDLVLENVENGQVWVFQVSKGGKAKFSRAFERYKPERKIIAAADSCYKYCL